MTNDAPVTADSEAECDPTQDGIDLVQMVGQSLNLALLYGPAHKVTQASFERSFPVLGLFMKRYGSLHIGVVEGELLINGASANGAPLAGNLVARLTSLNLLSLLIKPDLSLEEYRELLTLLITPPGKNAAGSSAADLVTAHGFEHIQAQNVAYRRVVEGDSAPAEPSSPPETPSSPTEPPPDLDKVMAFLKAPPQTGTDHVREHLAHMASDAEQLADLILRTADIRQQSADTASGESMTDLLVGCINRITDTLLTSPGTKSQKGRKQVKRNLLLLEKTLVDRLRALSSGSVDADAVSAAIRETAEDLDMESLAAKYMKTRRSAEKSEEQLKRLLDRTQRDADQERELRDSLMAQGLSEEGWRELVVDRAAAPAGPSGQDTQLQDIKTLALLLTQLGDTLQQTQSQPSASADAKLLALVSETRQQVTSVTAGTEQKIATLRELAEAPAEEGLADRALPMRRKALLKTLAEIAQELSQPLTVISATLEMLRSQKTGPLTASQGELLSLAAESSTRLARLVSRLMCLAGAPATLKPDRGLIGLDDLAGGATSPTSPTARP